MKIRLLITALTLFIFSCKNAENVVQFGMSSSLILDPDEINHNPISQKDVNQYGANCHLNSNEIFLNKVLSNEKLKYTIYIGTCETLHLSEAASLINSDSSFVILNNAKMNGKKSEFHNYLLKKNKHFIAKTIYNEPVSGLLVIYNYCSTDSILTNTYYSNLKNNFETKVSTK